VVISIVLGEMNMLYTKAKMAIIPAISEIKKNPALAK